MLACQLRAIAPASQALALNSRLGSDYWVQDFGGCSRDFVLAPSGEAEEAAAADALALVQAWVNRYSE